MRFDPSKLISWTDQQETAPSSTKSQALALKCIDKQSNSSRHTVKSTRSKNIQSTASENNQKRKIKKNQLEATFNFIQSNNGTSIISCIKTDSNAFLPPGHQTLKYCWNWNRWLNRNRLNNSNLFRPTWLYQTRSRRHQHLPPPSYRRMQSAR